MPEQFHHYWAQGENGGGTSAQRSVIVTAAHEVSPEIVRRQHVKCSNLSAQYERTGR